MKKRMMYLLMVFVLLVPVFCFADGTQWYCPQCGRLNDMNFCPADGTARPQMNNQSGEPDIHTYYFADNSIDFSSQIRAKVYTGPGSEYMRAAGGAAEFVSQSFKCGGMDGDWLFTRCQVKGGLRYGYILVGKEQQIVRNIPQLVLSDSQAVTNTSIALWDSLMDEDIGPLCYLEEGSRVTYLCNFIIDRITLAYVEADYVFQKVRGFTLPAYLNFLDN